MNTSVAEGEEVIQPDAVANDLGRKAVTVVQGRFCSHERKLSDQLPSLSPLLNLTIPFRAISK